MGNNLSTDINNDIASILFDKVSSLTDKNCEKLTGMLLELPKNDLELAIIDEDFLKVKLNAAIVSLQCYEIDLQKTNERHGALAEALYSRVQCVHNNVNTAGQITGMLLEIGDDAIEYLLQNDDELADKINKAASVLNVHKQSVNFKPDGPNEVDLAEKIFNKLTSWFSEEESSKITGMILEMNLNDIIKCSQDDKMLKEVADEAKSALNEKR